MIESVLRCIHTSSCKDKADLIEIRHEVMILSGSVYGSRGWFCDISDGEISGPANYLLDFLEELCSMGLASCQLSQKHCK